jgi:ketosteroid isomerase-like protein
VVTDMSDRNINSEMHRMFATFDAGDVTALAGFVTDDVRLRLGNAEMIRGKPAFIAAVDAFLASIAGVRHEILRVFIDGDFVTTEFDVRYTRHDGRVVTLPCCNVFRYRESLISEYRSYVDATTVYAEADPVETEHRDV